MIGLYEIDLIKTFIANLEYMRIMWLFTLRNEELAKNHTEKTEKHTI